MTRRFDTECVHCGTHPDPQTGALATPIYQTSTFAFRNTDEGARRFKGEEKGYIYTRLGNPNFTAVEEKIALLEGGEAAAVAASGMGAISSVLWTALSAGDHVLAAKTLYGCTLSLLAHQFPRFGIETTFMDLTDLSAVRAAMKPNTRVIYCESISNPTMAIADIAGLAKIAGENNALLVVDNTYCSPVVTRPLELGAHVVVHSATKYLNGHGDIIAGVAVGSAEFIGRVKMEGLKDLTGATLSPFDAYLLLRGLKTLHLRVPRHCENALKVAKFLGIEQFILTMPHKADIIPLLDEVDGVQLMSGGYDLSVAISGASFQEVAWFVARRLSPMDDVLSTATHFVLRTYKKDGALFGTEHRDERQGVL